VYDEESDEIIILIIGIQAYPEFGCGKLINKYSKNFSFSKYQNLYNEE
jgi:hypothetical protein